MASLATLVLAWLLASRLLPVRGALIALALVAASPALLSLGLQLKPYSGDVASALGLVLLSLSLLDGALTSRRAVMAGVIGVGLALLSNLAVLSLVGMGLTLAVVGSRKWRHRAPLVVLELLWAGGALLAAWLSLRQVTPSSAAYVDGFWAAGFPPSPTRVPIWLAGRVAALYRRPFLGLPFPYLHMAIAAVGVSAAFRRDRERMLVLLAPIATHLAAAVAHRYPFEGRLALHALPVFLLLEAAGAERISTMLGGAVHVPKGAGPRAARRVLPACFRALPALFIVSSAALDLARRPPPYLKEHVRPWLASLSSRLRPGDAIYVYYGAGQALAFYGPRYGLDPERYVLGGCHQGEPRRYLHELDAFRGRDRFWVLLVTHSLTGAREAELLGSYLVRIGSERERIASGGDMAATCYDLSDSRRLLAVAADSFPLPPAPDPAAVDCGHGPQSNRRIETWRAAAP